MYAYANANASANVHNALPFRHLCNGVTKCVGRVLLHFYNQQAPPTPRCLDDHLFYPDPPPWKHPSPATPEAGSELRGFENEVCFASCSLCNLSWQSQEVLQPHRSDHLLIRIKASST